MDQLVDLSSPVFWQAVVCITINPLYWNTVAQIEYYTSSISKLFCSSKKLSVTVLAITIILLNVLRTTMFESAIKSQPTFNISTSFHIYIGYVLILLGQFLTMSSFYKLGFYATFLADHFGLFTHDAPITSFPFSLISDPMYWGSSISYFGIALSQSSPSGLLLTLWIIIIYKLAIIQESKMLRIIYSKKAS
jgi:protein-S-isoprenylcysteine O-methyltransferase Ste14